MVIDTSVIVAVLLKETGYEDLVFRMAEADARYLSAGSYLEASIVLAKKAAAASSWSLTGQSTRWIS